MTMCVRMDPSGQIIPELKKFRDKELLKKLIIDLKVRKKNCQIKKVKY